MFERLQSLLRDLGSCRVLVLGDLILDEYLRGAVRRISPEAPVPVLESTASEQALGGAANVANNLRALGCEVLLCGAVGADAHGDALLGLLREQGVDTSGVVSVSGRPTTHKLRLVAQGQHVLRIDREEIGAVPAAAGAEIIERLKRLLPTVSGVICSDYKKGVVLPPVVDALMEMAGQAGKSVIVDPKGNGYQRYRGACILTPNLVELQQAAAMDVHGPEDMDAAARAVMAKAQCPSLLVTCGKDGMVLYESGGAKTHICAEAREVYDVTGAGDTVIATLALALFSGAPAVDAARLANVAAGVVVGKLGTATVSRGEVLEYLHHHGSPAQNKVVSRAAAREAVAKARVHGRRVVFTNGCFDLLHAGHVQYLQAARDLGDLLIVGLNSDASVRALKGESRPLIPQSERAQLLAALACVDWVVIFGESTPAEIIADLLPDVLAKGADYKLDNVVGRDTVEGAGGRVELIPLVEGKSTSRLVESIVARGSSGSPTGA